MTRRSSIGFDRRIELEWLDAAAAQATADVSLTDLRAYLWNLLDGVLSGDKLNSARGKTVTVLSHIWGEVPTAAISLRRYAGAQLAACTAKERLALHWAMMVGTYPIFTDVAAATGRLLTLQGSFTLAHLMRRLVGTWGERSTLSRAAQRIIRSMIGWGVLRDTPTRGVYQSASHRISICPTVGLTLIQAVLIDAEEGSLPLEQLVNHSALFPFELVLDAGQIRSAPQFQVHRQGLQFDFIELHAGA